MRGMPAYSMIEQADRKAFNEMLQSSLNTSMILDFQLTPTARMVLLPMATEDNYVTRILGCVSVEPNRPEFPARVSIQSVTKTRIRMAKSIKTRALSELAEN